MSSFIEALGQSSAASTTSSTQKKDNTTLGKEDFLSLLVAQMKYQDPLNPDDPTEFTSQLAQFSQLEQLFNINEGMETLASSGQSSDRLTALTTIGKEVAYAGSSFSFEGDPVSLGYQLESPASDVTVLIKKDGVAVAELSGEDLDKGTHYVSWDGLTAKGETAAEGNYTISVQAKGFENESLAVTPVIRSLVTGADLDTAGGGTLLTSSGEIEFGKILGVFTPSKSS